MAFVLLIRRLLLKSFFDSRQIPELNNVTVCSFDSLWGIEKDIIVICATDPEHVGYIADPGTMSVALTRARECLVVFGGFKNSSVS